MKINQLKAGVVLSYMTQAIHILSGLIYTPIMLRLLGQSEYGLYQLVNSVVSYLGLLSFGFSAGYVRFYSKYKADNDHEGLARFNGMFLTIFAAISLICLICGAFLLGNIRSVFGNGLTEPELRKARILMAMMVFSIAITLFSSVFKNSITAHQQFFFQRLLKLLQTLLNPFLTLPLLIMGYGSVGMVCVSTFLTILVFIIDAAFCLKKLRMKFSFRGFDLSLLKEMWVFTFFIFINLIVDQINWSVDKFLLGRMLGTVAVAVYGIAATLNSMYLSFSSAISSVFIPKVNLLVAQKQDDSVLSNLFTRVGRVQFLILGLAATGYTLYGKEFIHFWAGKGYENSYYIGLLLMLPATVPLIQNLGIEIQRAKNKHKVRSVVYFFIALSNIFISLWCINIWGVVGAAVGTAISLIIGNILFMNIYYHKKLRLNMLYFWGEILKFTPAIVLSVVIGLLFKHFVPANSIVLLVANIVVYCITYAISMWFFGMNKSERDLISAPVSKIFKKIRG